MRRPDAERPGADRPRAAVPNDQQRKRIETDRTAPFVAAVDAWRQLVVGMGELGEVVDAWRDGCVPMSVAVVEIARRARALEAIVLAAEVAEVAS